MNPADIPTRNERDVPIDRPLPCEEIQALMLDYMQHDLGEGRSDVVREHARRCPECRARLTELHATMGMLHHAGFPQGPLPEHLSEQHRARLTRALMHPILDWIYVHHILVSTLVAILLLLAMGIGLRSYKVWRANTIGPGIPVTIGAGAAEPAGQSMDGAGSVQ
ncbi:MAG: zf-HC2 domain-containing protein [Lentisphaerae bacterium]|nr:zf-HC2 domain-containing protein [Lentisphaerota bacterium]